MDVPFLNLKIQHRTLASEILPLWQKIFESASFIDGKHLVLFEEEFANTCGVDHCVAVNSGTDALRFILIALDLKPGDEVITVPNSFIATSEAISQAGGKIIFVDVDSNTYNMDPTKIEFAITSKTRGIIPVHLYGQMADMDPISDIAKKHDLWVVEDSCQAHLAEYKGHKAGSMGVAAAFSFYPGKNLGACGEAGAITTMDADLAAQIRMLRNHGQAKKYYHEIEGYNSRCDELQAAALRIKLKYLPSWNEARRKHAQQYFELMSDVNRIILPKISNDCLSVFHLFVIQIENRNAVAQALAEKGIGTGLHYPVPLHLQKAYTNLNLTEGTFPETESCSKRLLSLPMYPELTEDQISYVCECLTGLI